MYRFFIVLFFCINIVSCQEESSDEDNSETLNSSSELTILLADVASDTDTDRCVSIVYPITVFSYNSSFQMESTGVVTNDSEFHLLLENLESSEYYSINYPVSLTINGQSVSLNNNQQLSLAIHAAMISCDQTGCENPQVLVQDLLFYVTFSSGIAVDLKGNTMTVPSNIGFGPDRSGNGNCAIMFNGQENLHIPASATNTLVAGDGFSISLWFKMQNTIEGDLEFLFRKGDVNGQGFYIAVYDMNTPMFGMSSGEVWDTDWNHDQSLWYDTQSWHHLVATVDSDNTMKLYRDGILRNMQTNPNGNIGAQAADYYIGQNFTGMMDDLRIYKKVLTQQEVQTLFELSADCNTCLE
jgi:hypothetical protein